MALFEAAAVASDEQIAQVQKWLQHQEELRAAKPEYATVDQLEVLQQGVVGIARQLTQQMTAAHNTAMNRVQAVEALVDQLAAQAGLDGVPDDGLKVISLDQFRRGRGTDA